MTRTTRPLLLPAAFAGICAMFLVAVVAVMVGVLRPAGSGADLHGRVPVPVPQAPPNLPPRSGTPIR